MVNEVAQFLDSIGPAQKVQVIVHYAHLDHCDFSGLRTDCKDGIKHQAVLNSVKQLFTSNGPLIHVIQNTTIKFSPLSHIH